jgi:hypothetical protein
LRRYTVVVPLVVGRNTRPVLALRGALWRASGAAFWGWLFSGRSW